MLWVCLQVQHAASIVTALLQESSSTKVALSCLQAVVSHPDCANRLAAKPNVYQIAAGLIHTSDKSSKQSNAISECAVQCVETCCLQSETARKVT